MKCLKVGCMLVIMLQSFSVYADSYELEVCQFIGTIRDSKGRVVPPGLDEPLNCDHKCFYDELGIHHLSTDLPNLHDMYSIGWRLIQLRETLYEGRVIWTVYLERKSNGKQNDCDVTYAPKQPGSKTTTKGTTRQQSEALQRLKELIPSEALQRSEELIPAEENQGIHVQLMSWMCRNISAGGNTRLTRRLHINFSADMGPVEAGLAG